MFMAMLRREAAMRQQRDAEGRIAAGRLAAGATDRRAREGEQRGQLAERYGAVSGEMPTAETFGGEEEVVPRGQLGFLEAQQRAAKAQADQEHKRRMLEEQLGMRRDIQELKGTQKEAEWGVRKRIEDAKRRQEAGEAMTRQDTELLELLEKERQFDELMEFKRKHELSTTEQMSEADKDRAARITAAQESRARIAGAANDLELSRALADTEKRYMDAAKALDRISRRDEHEMMLAFGALAAKLRQQAASGQTNTEAFRADYGRLLQGLDALSEGVE
jgi:hypothetical protein